MKNNDFKTRGRKVTASQARKTGSLSRFSGWLLKPVINELVNNAGFICYKWVNF